MQRDGRRRTLEPLRQAGFGRLAVSSLVNELGNWLGEIALAIVVFDQTGSPIATAGLFVAMQFIPALATPPVVARVDALHSRNALGVLYLGEALAFCGLAALATDETFVLAGVLVLAAARARTRAAAASILEPVDLLREGNAILNMGFTAGAAVGPALAGLLVAVAGAQVSLLADAASFLAVAALLTTSRSLPAAHEDETGGWIARLRRAVTYVRKRAPLRRLLWAEGVAFLFFALVLPIEVAFAKDTLDAGDFGYGLLLAAWGVGMVAGSVVFSSFSRAPLPVLLVAGTLGIGLSYVGTALAPTLAVACLTSVIGGVGNGVQWVAVVTTRRGCSACSSPSPAASPASGSCSAE
jgi:MFS family permease